MNASAVFRTIGRVEESEQSSGTPIPVEPTGRSLSRRAASRRRRRRDGITMVIGVFGELLLTGGVCVLLFLGWELYLNNVIAGNQQAQQAFALNAAWSQQTDLGKEVGFVQKAGQPQLATDIPVLGAKPAMYQTFASLIVPRFGQGWIRSITEGTDDKALSMGIGAYTSGSLPGALGNFTLASHRDIDGGAFHDIDQLETGDTIYVATQDGWYKYTFRSHEVVNASDVSVIAPVPDDPGVTPTERYITFTTCNPKWSSIERIIAYGVFDSFTPRQDGPPADIAWAAGTA